jgi:tRNA pseudouridine32 synthase / 23S rRNA pseudouridine746 synthase
MISTPPKPIVYAPPDTPVAVLYQDDDLLVLSKPSGLLTVPGKPAAHADCVESRIQEQFPSARIVHRLDMDTSGILVMAMNPQAHRHIGLQFERRKIDKTYTARVWGEMSDTSGHISAPLRCDWPNRPKQIIDFEQGRKAETAWQVIEIENGTTRVLLHPRTGRSHQLRVHMLSLGHPILGDNLYAHDEALQAADRLQLHSTSLTLHHPKDGTRVKFTNSCPF